MSATLGLTPKRLEKMLTNPHDLPLRKGREIKDPNNIRGRTKTMGPIHEVGSKVLTRAYLDKEPFVKEAALPGTVTGYVSHLENAGFGRRELSHRVKLDSGKTIEEYGMNMRKARDQLNKETERGEHRPVVGGYADHKHGGES